MIYEMVIIFKSKFKKSFFQIQNSINYSILSQLQLFKRKAVAKKAKTYTSIPQAERSFTYSTGFK